MKNVQQINQIIEQEQTDEAHMALDELLVLGPNNIEALKLKALLYGYEGSFDKEFSVWNRISTIDPEDPDAIRFFLEKQIEDREFFYFTEGLPEGGRRYLAYPRSLIQKSIFGLMGCFIFLTITKLAKIYPLLGESMVLLICFFVTVILPWLAIIYSYMTGLRSVNISSYGLEIISRFKIVELAWKEVSDIYLAHATIKEKNILELLLIQHDKQKPAIALDLSPSSSSIRALSYFMKDISKFFKEPVLINREKVLPESQAVVTY